MKPFLKTWRSPGARFARAAILIAALAAGAKHVQPFWKYSQEMAQGMSQPSVMFKGVLNDGRTIMVKDYLEAYWWVRDNTPQAGGWASDTGSLK